MAATVSIDAILNGPAGSSEMYVFRGDQVVVYDWNLDRATSGGRSITDWWSLPAGFGTFGVNIRIDAAFAAHETEVAGYEDHTYFFHNAVYTRHDWSAAVPRPNNGETGIDNWRLDNPPFDGVDTALNGRYSRLGKSYFFRGGQYGRYDWAQDVLDYVKPIDQFAPGTVPAAFQSGIDATANGQGAYVTFAYFFKGSDYIRLDWDPTGTTPTIDSGIRPILGNWRGVMELVAAGEGKTKAFEWLWSAIAQVTAYRDALNLGIPYPDAALMHAALATHFRLTNPSNVASVNAVLSNLTAAEQALHKAPTIFRAPIESEYVTDGRAAFKRNPDGTFQLDAAGQKILDLDADGLAQPDAAAYTRYQQWIAFTKLYPTKGEACRAAQVIHEALHYVDNQNGAPNDIPEWYVTTGAAPALGLTPQPFTFPVTEVAHRYDLMPESVALHNPSSFSAFAQHLRYRQDTRYGEVKQNPLPGLW